jgi:hypothetical protein
MKGTRHSEEQIIIQAALKYGFYVISMIRISSCFRRNDAPVPTSIAHFEMPYND